MHDPKMPDVEKSWTALRAFLELIHKAGRALSGYMLNTLSLVNITLNLKVSDKKFV